jgi:dTDP-4-amino-4,6-dideoxygalactose transaminase
MVASLHGLETPARLGGTPVRPELLHFSRPRLSDAEIASVVETLRSGWLTTAAKAREFEDSFKSYIGLRHAVALNSCTAGLFLSLKALKIGPGDEVITTPLTFAASVNVIEHVGAKPVFADIDPTTWCIDPSRVEKCVTSATRAMIPVHLYGYPCDMDSLRSIAGQNGLKIVQDCAHAIETEWNGRSVGSFGDIACYSFYATKNVTTAEGGMIATDNEAWADRIRVLALHGLDKTAYDRYTSGGKPLYDLLEPGYKFNMPDTAAALGVEGLKLVDQRHRRREEIWRRYCAELSDLPGLTLPPETGPGHRHGRHLFVCALDPRAAGLDRDRMIEYLAAENIGSGVHYTPVHFFKYYRTKYALEPGQFPRASDLGTRVFSLPLTAFLSDKDVDDVIRAVRKIVLFHAKQL